MHFKIISLPLCLFIILCFSYRIYSSDLSNQGFERSKKTILIRKDIGIGVGLGVVDHYYASKSNYWLPNHAGPSFFLDVLFRDFYIDLFFKPATVTANNPIFINSDTLPTNVKFNPVKTGINLGYIYCPLDFIWIEPKIGYSFASFPITANQNLSKDYKIPSQSGFSFGSFMSIPLYRNYFSFYMLRLGADINLAPFNKIDSRLDTHYYLYSAEFILRHWGTKVKKGDISKYRILQNKQ